MLLPKDFRIAIIGLGYVGLPLAVEFGKKYQVTGFGIKQPRKAKLKAGRDSTREVEPAKLAEASQLSFTADLCNTKVIDVVRELAGYDAKVDFYDPFIDVAEAVNEYQVTPLTVKPQANSHDAIILIVICPEFLELGPAGIRAFCKLGHVFMTSRFSWARRKPRDVCKW